MVATGVDVTSALVDSVVSLRYEDIPPQVVQIARNSVLDSLGVMLAASTQGAGCQEMVQIVEEAAGKQESTVLAFGGKAPCWMAGFANGALIHALDYDDIYYPGLLHPSNTVFPSALAMAERKRAVSGKQFITALVSGGELVCRLGLSLTTPPATEVIKRNWQIRQTLGVFGGTAAAGKILGLDRRQMNSALGIASQQAAGTREVTVGTGSILRGLYAAPVGLWGPLACLMAERGITGPPKWLEGTKGLYQVYFDGMYNRDVLAANLGKTFEYARTGYKPWPSCAHTHSYLDATLRAVRENNLKPRDVVEVTAVVGDATKALFEPLEMRRRPPTTMDAKWSLPYTMACAIAKGKVGLASFTPEGIRDRETLEMAQKVSPQYDTTLEEIEGSQPALVSIRTKSGKRYDVRVEYAYGHFRNPMSREDLVAKFRDCASFSVKPLSAATVDKVIETVDRLEELDDISRLVQLVS